MRKIKPKIASDTSSSPGGPFSGLTMQVQLKSSYGRDRIYPICPVSRALMALTQGKTFSPEQLKHLANQGMVIEWIPGCVELDT